MEIEKPSIERNWLNQVAIKFLRQEICVITHSAHIREIKAEFVSGKQVPIRMRIQGCRNRDPLPAHYQALKREKNGKTEV